MNKFLVGILGAAMLSTTLQAWDVSLTKKRENVYLMEITNQKNGDNATSLVKDIARSVKRKGFKVFCLPPTDDWTGENTCYMILAMENTKDLKKVADKYGYDVWNVDWVLG